MPAAQPLHIAKYPLHCGTDWRYQLVKQRLACGKFWVMFIGAKLDPWLDAPLLQFGAAGMRIIGLVRLNRTLITHDQRISRFGIVTVGGRKSLGADNA